MDDGIPTLEPIDERDQEVLFEPAPKDVTVVERNGVELIVPKRSARKKCTVNDILSAIGGEIEPINDPSVQSSFGDNGRLARKMGVTVATVRAWRQRYPLVDNAMKEEQERDKDWVEMLARSAMISGDTQMTRFWLEAKARDRGFGREKEKIVGPELSNDTLNKKLKQLSPRDRLRLLAESHTSGTYEGQQGQADGGFS